MDGDSYRLVSVRMWNSNNNDQQESNKSFFGWVWPDVKNEDFERLRVHLIFCSDNDVQEMVSELISLVDNRVVGDLEFSRSKMGTFVEAAGFKIFEAKSKTTKIADSFQRTELTVVFDEIKLEISDSSSEASQDSNDMDSMDSARYYTESLRDYFDGF